MRRIPVLAALFAVAIVAPRSTAQVTIDFQSLESTNGQTVATYIEDGFSLTPGSGMFEAYGTSSPHYPGSTALFLQTPDSTITLTRVGLGGEPFDLTSIDVSELLNNGTTHMVPLNFTGNKATGGTVTAHFDLDGTFGFQTLTFSDFTNVTSVSWVQEDLAGTEQYHQFDNIVVAPVPEPATALGFAALCGGALGLIRRYRRRHASPAGSSSESAGDFMTSRSNTVA